MTFYAGSLPNPGTTNTRLTGNTATTVVAAANKPQSVAKIHIANVSASTAVAATIDIHDGAAVVVKLLNIFPLPAAGSPYEIRDILLDKGQSLRVTSGDAAGQLHVHVIHSLTNIPGA